jgi:hypothetical protein
LRGGSQTRSILRQANLEVNMTASNVVPTEADRVRLANDLTVEAGPGWADGYQPGSPGCHELLDRASLLSDMTERYLVGHPACIANPGWYALAERAAAALRELYQQIGAEHLGTEQGGSEHAETAGPVAPLR